MTPNRLLDHFDRISEAPDAIPRLRRFVLDLAVRGKLVEQDTNDEPASELLKRIQAEKTRLVKDGKIGNQSLVKDDAEAELPFPVPETWEWTPATSPTVLMSDHGKKIQTKDVLQAGKFPVVDQGKLFIRGYCNDSDKVIYVEEPVIIFGDHTRETKLVDFNFVVGADGVKILNPIQILPAYYFLTLQWLPLDSRGYGRHFKLLRAMKIPLPPLAEQHRIVAKVDELMALCDRLEAAQVERESWRVKLMAASLHRLNHGGDAESFREHARFHLRHLPRLTTRPEHIQQFRQTILNLAVRGQLVPQDPNDEPIHESLRGALELRGALVRTRKVRHKNFDDCAGLDKPVDLPASWIVERLGNLVDPENTISYGVLVPGNDTHNGVPFVRAQDLTLSSHPQRPNKTISPDIEKAYARTRLRGGEILLCVVGSIGKLGTVPKTWAGANIARAVARIKPIKEISRDYLLVMLQASPVKSYFNETTRTLAQPTLNIGLIEQTPIPLSPLAEQHRIVAKVDELMALCDRLEAQLTTAQTESSRLLEAVLHEAIEEGKRGVIKLSAKC